MKKVELTAGEIPIQVSLVKSGKQYILDTFGAALSRTFMSLIIDRRLSDTAYWFSVKQICTCVENGVRDTSLDAAVCTYLKKTPPLAPGALARLCGARALWRRSRQSYRTNKGPTYQRQTTISISMDSL